MISKNHMFDLDDDDEEDDDDGGLLFHFLRE